MCTISQPSKKRTSFTQSASKSIKAEPLSPPISNKALAVVKTDTDCSDTSNVICFFTLSVFYISIA